MCVENSGDWVEMDGDGARLLAIVSHLETEFPIRECGE